jgi:hypothetical protein
MSHKRVYVTNTNDITRTNVRTETNKFVCCHLPVLLRHTAKVPIAGDSARRALAAFCDSSLTAIIFLLFVPPDDGVGIWHQIFVILPTELLARLAQGWFFFKAGHRSTN